MFVRKRAGGNQLVESYRDDAGRPRQRVVCNLGKHETPEEALEAARSELEDLLAEPRRLERSIARNEAYLKKQYARGLERWHGGGLPPLEEVIEMASERVKPVDYRDNWPRDTNLEHVDYVKDFVLGYGRDLSDFIWELRDREEWKEEARAAREAVAQEESALRERIATLEGVLKGVVSK
jgi:hypothetical protein